MNNYTFHKIKDEEYKACPYCGSTEFTSKNKEYAEPSDHDETNGSEYINRTDCFCKNCGCNFYELKRYYIENGIDVDGVKLKISGPNSYRLADEFDWFTGLPDNEDEAKDYKLSLAKFNNYCKNYNCSGKATPIEFYIIGYPGDLIKLIEASYDTNEYNFIFSAFANFTTINQFIDNIGEEFTLSAEFKETPIKIEKV